MRVSASSFAIALRTCVRTVSGEMKRLLPISSFDIPSASSLSTSRSRWVRFSILSVAAELDSTPALHEIPILLDDADEPTPVRLTVDRARLADGFGIFSRDQVRDRLSMTRLDPPPGGLDWGQVVELRRRASETITEEAAHQARATGRPLSQDDRVLMGRAIIRRVVGDHVRALHREGAELWSPTQEQAYVTAVEDALLALILAPWPGPGHPSLRSAQD